MNLLFPKNPEIYQGKNFTNLNPQIGEVPLGEIRVNKSNMVFSANITDKFSREQITTRPRPHFAGIHITLINDAICSSVFEIMKNEEYGDKKRYVETNLPINFKKEVFLKDSVKEIPRHSIIADSFQAFWQILDINGKPIENRGYLDVTIAAVTKTKDLVPILFSRCTYLKLKGIK